MMRLLTHIIHFQFLSLALLKTITDPPLPWKTIEKNPRKTVHSIEKIDNFNGQGAPLLRFRSTLTGPCIGECFANFIMDLDQRRQWDTQIADVTELYPVHDLDSANIAMGFGRYGDCSRLGVGYCLTKAGLGISPREQLTLCGIQDFCHDGADNNDDDDDESSGASCVIWGTEMADKRHNDLFPPGTGRHTRAKSHIFATTLTPTSDTTFDVEYVLQLEIGGSLPTWLTTPIVIDSIKSLFRTAEAFFADDRKGSGLDRYLQDKAAQQASQFNFANHQGLLMTP